MENQEEIWKEIEELDRLYEVSNLGNLRRKERYSHHSYGGLMKVSSRKTNCQDNGRGYKQIYVQVNRKRKLMYVHRLVAMYFLDNPLNKKEVNHKDGNKANNSFANLEWTTKAENMAHASANNLTAKGEKGGGAKLTNEKILAIRRLYKINPKFNKLALSRKLNVRDTTIHKIIRNQRWKHI